MPADQVMALYWVVAGKGLPVALEIFHSKGHGFRIASNIHRAYTAKLNFYTQV